MKGKLILASESPRRKEILINIGCEFETIPAGINEESVKYDGENPELYVMNIADLKAHEVSDRYPDSIIIAADTIVVFNNEVYGKPKDRISAKAMLTNLSGNCHQVYTGVCVKLKNKNINLKNYMSTEVWFDILSEDEINRYLYTDEYKDKAGAYGIQGKGALLVKKIDGCFFNVMGLPINLLETMLNRIGISFFV